MDLREVWRLLGLPVERWDSLREKVEDPNLRQALTNATTRFATRREEALRGVGDFAKVQERGREIKERALAKAEELWVSIESQFTRRGGVIHHAATAEEARNIIKEMAEEAKVDLVVKGKSITSEEIELNPALQEEGIEVVETDLGERIIQLAGEPPSHLIVPAVHRTVEEVAQIFERHWGREVPRDPFLITKEVRKEIRQKFLTAHMGITGINAIAADRALFMLMTNEGNGRLCATLPPLQVIITGYEKVVETLADGLFLLDILPRNSVGLTSSSYVSLFSAPFKWKEGRQLHLVVVDNGRKKALEDPQLKETLRCIRCGACMNVCPVYQSVGGQRFSHIYMGGIGAAWTAITAGYEAAKDVADLCTTCGTCLEVCPVGIDIPKLVEVVRERAKVATKVRREALKALERRERLQSLSLVMGMMPVKQMPELPGALGELAGKAVLPNPPLKPFHAWAKEHGITTQGGEVTLYAGCMIEYLYPQIAEDAVELLRLLGVTVQIIKEECCGHPHEVMGETLKGRVLEAKNLEEVDSRKPLLFLCATCLSGLLKGASSRKIKALDLSQFLLKRFPEKSFGSLNATVAYHLPCHLGRHAGVKEEPYALLERVEGVQLVRGDEESLCCGGAGLYRFTHPPVSKEILRRKMEWLENSGAEYLLTSCPSCIMQLTQGVKEAGLDIKVEHLASFLLKALRSHEG